MRINRIVLLVIIFLFSIRINAQQEYLIKHYGVEEGLSNNYIVDIAQDKQGYIWIATESGLNRFDGNSFEIYKQNNSTICSNSLNALYYNEHDNTLWAGSQRDGISVFDCSTNQFKETLVEERIMSNDVTHFSPAADGGIWVTHYHRGVEHYNVANGNFTTYPDLEIPNMKGPNWCSAEDGNGSLYVGHVYAGISIIDLKNRTARNFTHNPHQANTIPGNEVRSICIDRQKNIWIGTNEGLALFNRANETFISFKHDPKNPYSLAGNAVYSIKEMADGTLWICSDMGGVSILDLKNTTFMNPANVKFKNIVMTNDNHGLSSANPHTTFQDHYGNIWIGNYRGGINFISHTQPLFHTLPYSTDRYGKQNSKQVWGICMDTEQQIWIGGENEIVAFKEQRPSNVKALDAFTSKQYTHINTISLDRKGMMWLGMYNAGIVRFNPKTQQVEKLNIRNNEDIRCFYEDRDEKMWIGSENGIFSYKNGIANPEIEINTEIYDQKIRSFLRDRQDKLWIATFGQGIFILGSNNKRLHWIGAGNGLTTNAVNHLIIDSKGEVWAALRGGVAHFNDTNNPASFEVYADKHGLEDNQVRAIQEDLQGNIWISTNSGISLWDRSNKRFLNYNHHDGVPMGDFMDGAVCRDEEGTLYFGSQNGVCYFYPPSVLKPQKVSPVKILECKGFNQLERGREEEFFIPMENNKIELQHDDNSFSIRFNVADYNQSPKVEYSYKMVGLANAWYNIKGDQQVTFRNLSPGNYTFNVRAYLRNQKHDTSNQATISVIIHPPLWLTWYAKLIYILITGFIIWGLLRFYIRRIELESSLQLERRKTQNELELNQERMRFYTNITHELRTPLTLILGPIEDLLRDKDMTSYHYKKIGLVHGNTLRLLNLINQLLDFRKVETQNRSLTVCKGNLATLVAEIGLRYKELNTNQDVSFHTTIETRNTELYFDTEAITTVLNNLLSNALKYTPKGSISLRLFSETKNGIAYTTIQVNDTGYGISADAIPHIFDCYYQAKEKHQASGTGIGLSLVKALVKLHEGTINVNSTLGRGSSFTFSLQTDNTYPGALHKERGGSEEKGIKALLTNSNSNRPILLVVEDNEEIREYICESFNDKYEIISAANGKEGAKLAQSYIPNIIISDIMMPIMNGIEFCRIIKGDMSTSHIPVILLTAKDSIQDKEEGYECGADSYLTKPFSAKLLETRMQNLLDMRKRLAQQMQHSQENSAYRNSDNQIIDATKTTVQTKLNKLDTEFIDKMTRIIKENIEIEKLDVGFIAEKMGMSHSTLYRKTKGVTDLSINEFVRKIKIRHCATLMNEEGYNVSEAAVMVGFYNRGYFCQLFKHEFGVNPSEYIKQAKNQASSKEIDK